MTYNIVKQSEEVELHPRIHPEDIELDDVPTTLESLIGEFAKSESSDAEECFDDDNIYVKRPISDTYDVSLD